MAVKRKNRKNAGTDNGSQRVTRARVQALLDAEDYSKAKRLGAKALPYLGEIAASNDLQAATQAIFVAGLIDHEDSVAIISKAASQRKWALRIAAAGAASNLSPIRAKPILARLLKSRVPGIRKWAIKGLRLVAEKNLPGKDSSCINELCQILDKVYRDSPISELDELTKATLNEVQNVTNRELRRHS